MDTLCNQPWETACVFGAQCQLTGVYTASLQTTSERPCVLFLSAGLLHHIGPNRLYVELARNLSRQGVSGLRFDLSGVGDSEPISLGGDLAERSVREITAAMDYLELHYGHGRFVLLSLGSGADDALATAQHDPRVSGIALLNAYAYPAGRFRLHRFLKYSVPRLFMWQKSRNGAATLRQEIDEHSHPALTQAETSAALVSLCSAATDVLFLFTGSKHDSYNYQGQLKAMFPALNGNRHLSERYLPEADHALILKQDREKVVEWVSEWFLQSTFGRSRL